VVPVLKSSEQADDVLLIFNIFVSQQPENTLLQSSCLGHGLIGTNHLQQQQQQQQQHASSSSASRIASMMLVGSVGNHTHAAVNSKHQGQANQGFTTS
jgi:hypothetical protein